MTDATALTPQRARDLGRSLAFRLHPRPGDSDQLAEMASLALLSLLPTWLPPGEGGCAAALRQLVRDPSFAAYVLAPAVAAVAAPVSRGVAAGSWPGLALAAALYPPGGGPQPQPP